jgi:hypothetical protein
MIKKVFKETGFCVTEDFRNPWPRKLGWQLNNIRAERDWEKWGREREKQRERQREEGKSFGKKRGRCKDVRIKQCLCVWKEERESVCVCVKGREGE